jgi:polyphosphate kinase 2 (PPK2 family)
MVGSVPIQLIPDPAMLKNIDLTREVPKPEYKRLKAEADLKLAALQRQAKALGVPSIVVFEGWSAAGKGTLINEMILPLDPCGDFGSELQPVDGWRFSIEAGTAG